MSIANDYDFILWGLSKSVEKAESSVKEQKQFITEVQKKAEESLRIHKQSDEAKIEQIKEKINDHKEKYRKDKRNICIWVACLTLFVVLIILDNQSLYDMLNKLFDIIK